MSSYESHAFLKDDFPLIFHRDQLSPMRNDFIPHWHDNVELLCFLSGSCRVLIEAEHLPVQAGDLIVVNSNRMHAAYPEDGVCQYDCLIVGRSFLEGLGLPMGQLVFEQKLSAAPFLPLLNRLWEEKQARRPYYKALCKSLAAELMVALARDHAQTGQTGSPGRMDRIREGLIYLTENFSEPVTVEQVCKAAGLSKYYFCRLFREYTGMSVIQYLNRLRCEEARRLLASGQYNVSQSAQMAGFNNLSYFTRMYARHMGALPSKER